MLQAFHARLHGEHTRDFFVPNENLSPPVITPADPYQDFPICDA